MSAVLAPRRNRADLTSACFDRLRSELLQALATNPQTVVQAPGYGIQYTAAMVVADELGGDDAALDSLLRLVSGAAKGEDVQLRASAWLAERANKHAKFHCEDFAVEIEDGEDRL